MKQRVRELVEQGDKLFSKRTPLLSVWQSMAENFYPMRADFTVTRNIGDEFASNLMTGRPVLAHRDLGNALSAMLRPRGSPWFYARTMDEDINEDPEARQWLDAKSDVMRRIMYDQRSQFVRATKQGDNDFTAFGQCVISIDPNKYLDGLLYRSWHLRDCVWCENSELVIDTFHREWKLEAREYMRLFPKTASQKVQECVSKEPYREIKCRHIVMPSDQYDYNEEKGKRKLPFVSLYVDVENDTILEEVPARNLNYVIPRWVTVSGSQYAYSPASVVALPDARMLQQITLTLLEAGQKAVDPPLKATSEAIVGGVNIHAGGITWVDKEYDEKLGKALEPLMDAPPGLNWGVEREERIERLIHEAFYLNRITLPDAGQGDMTKYEVQKRMEEYIRGALPLFEPMEVEYNGAICEKTWDHAMMMGAFGPMDDMPEILSGQEVRWQFESPLQAANERAKSQAFMEAANLLTIAAQLHPSARHRFDVGQAFGEALIGVGAPSDWIVSEEDAAAAAKAEQQAMAMQQAAQAVQQGALVAQDVGKAGQELAAAGMTPGAAAGIPAGAG
jgi:hypothetical protein